MLTVSEIDIVWRVSAQILAMMKTPVAWVAVATLADASNLDASRIDNVLDFRVATMWVTVKKSVDAMPMKTASANDIVQIMNARTPVMIRAILVPKASSATRRIDAR